MAEDTTSYAAEGKRLEIAKKAEELAVAYKTSSYSQTGKSTTAMDCSYFVYLVFSAVFPDFKYLNSTGIINSPLFQKSAKAAPGDIIFFAEGDVPYEVKKKSKRTSFPNHVGIVVDASSWVGRQSSKLGLVKFSDVWWGSRPSLFYSYTAYDAAHVFHNSSAFRKIMA